MARNVFLSFVEEDLTLVNLFRGQAKKEDSQLEFQDYSIKEAINSKNADYIKQQIRDLIRKVSVTAVLIGYRTYTSDWVAWGVQTSGNLGKGVVGVRLHSSASDMVPQGVSKQKAEVVDWDIKEIVRAIERAAKKAGY